MLEVQFWNKSKLILFKLSSTWNIFIFQFLSIIRNYFSHEFCIHGSGLIELSEDYDENPSYKSASLNFLFATSIGWNFFWWVYDKYQNLLCRDIYEGYEICLFNKY